MKQCTMSFIILCPTFLDESCNGTTYQTTIPWFGREHRSVNAPGAERKCLSEAPTLFLSKIMEETTGEESPVIF